MKKVKYLAHYLRQRAAVNDPELQACTSMNDKWNIE